MEQKRKLTGEVLLDTSFMEGLKESVLSIQEAGIIITDAQKKEATDFFKLLLATGFLLEASDIHLEPEENGVKLRFRKDGILQDIAILETKHYETLLSRIKLVSGLKLNIQEKPQDGRFTFQIENNQPIETRVSSLPSEYGESLVLRLLNPKNLRTLKDLALTPEMRELFEKEIRKPNGMILVTGPTGSGKTTTLYAFLQDVKSSEIKVVTIEDPIEYHLEGVSQTQVQGEYTFASGLRAIVRQDPDVILVGEIRDNETADIAVQASLTGHLVFSTLHTNDSAGTIARFLSLGGNAQTIAAALNLVIAQRLVRTLCASCAKERIITKKEYQTIERTLTDAPISYKKIFTESMKLKEAGGCALCWDTGYRGRIGIFEAMEITDEIRLFISKAPSIAEIKEYQRKHGVLSMLQDGFLKIAQGLTTFQEVQKVTEE